MREARILLERHSAGEVTVLPILLEDVTDAELRTLSATAGANAMAAVASPRRAPIDTAPLAAALQKYDSTAID